MKSQYYVSIILCTLFFSVHEISYSQMPNWLWSKSAGGVSPDQGNSNAVDAMGNCYVTGFFTSSHITFGSTTLTNHGNRDFFIVKYDANGNVLWAKSAGGSGFDNGSSVAVDANGYCYVIGDYDSGSITFGTTVLTNSGPATTSDIFIVKYDPMGNVLWAITAGGSSNEDLGNGITADANGNCYITGAFKSSTINFGSTTLTNVTNNFKDDIFIAKYDAAGILVWARSAGGFEIDVALAIDVDANGNSFVTGYFESDTMLFGNTSLLNSGSGDIFIVKYDPNGNSVWSHSAVGNDYDIGISIAADANGNCSITGNFRSATLMFGSTTLINSGGAVQDFFITKYDSSGNVLWAKSATGNGTDNGMGIETDANGNSYVTGYFYSSVIVFGGAILQNTTVGGGNADLFVVKYNSAGTALWAKKAISDNNDRGYDIAIDASGSSYVTGLFSVSTIIFGNDTLTNSGASDDMFIAKLDSDITSGFENVESTNGVFVYPNPANDYLSIAFKSSDKKVEVIITDITGKIIYSTTTTNKQKLEVNTKDFAQGIYFVQVQTNDFVQTRKVIVAR